MKKVLFLLPVLILTACDNQLSQNKTIQNELKRCGDECGQIIANGELGDFLIKLPETAALRNIANSNKNAKFLSIKDPKQYSMSGYCLLNIIPLKAMEKLGTPENTCNYRLYCGAPENMNYDEFYAVEICE